MPKEFLDNPGRSAEVALAYSKDRFVSPFPIALNFRITIPPMALTPSSATYSASPTWVRILVSSLSTIHSNPSDGIVGIRISRFDRSASCLPFEPFTSPWMPQAPDRITTVISGCLNDKIKYLLFFYLVCPQVSPPVGFNYFSFAFFAQHRLSLCSLIHTKLHLF